MVENWKFYWFQFKIDHEFEKIQGEIYSKLSLDTMNSSYQKTNTENDCVANFSFVEYKNQTFCPLLFRPGNNKLWQISVEKDIAKG